MGFTPSEPCAFWGARGWPSVVYADTPGETPWRTRVGMVTPRRRYGFQACFSAVRRSRAIDGFPAWNEVLFGQSFGQWHAHECGHALGRVVGGYFVSRGLQRSRGDRPSMGHWERMWRRYVSLRWRCSRAMHRRRGICRNGRSLRSRRQLEPPNGSPVERWLRGEGRQRGGRRRP